MDLLREYDLAMTRRKFFGTGVSSAVGWAALTSLLGEDKARGAAAPPDPTKGQKLPGLAHHAPKAKHVIYLHMVGGPPQMDLYDYKPKMNDWYDKDVPKSVFGT